MATSRKKLATLPQFDVGAGSHFGQSWMPIAFVGAVLPIVLYWIGGLASDHSKMPFVGLLLYTVISIIPAFLAGATAFMYCPSDNMRRGYIVASGSVASFMSVLGVLSYWDPLNVKIAPDAPMEQIHRHVLEGAMVPISNVCSDYGRITTLYSAALGSRPLRKADLHAMQKAMAEPLKTISELGNVQLTAKARAELTLVSEIVRLWNNGPQYPRCDANDKIGNRFVLVCDVYRALTQASAQIENDRFYFTFLTCRLATAVAAKVLLDNVKDKTKESQDEVNEWLTSVTREIDRRRHQDGLMLLHCLTWESWLATLENTDDLLKAKLGECAHAINNPAISGVSSEANLRVRLRVLWLSSFSNLASRLEGIKPEHRAKFYLELVNQSRTIDGTKTESLVDQSLEALRNIVTDDTAADDVVSIWWDDLLVKYAKLESDLRTAKLWEICPLFDHKVLRIVIREQIRASQKLMLRLSNSDELSPDYIDASILLHAEAARRWDWDEDPKGFQNLIKYGKEFAERRLSNRGLLHTPLRAPCNCPEDPSCDEHLRKCRASLEDFARLERRFVQSDNN